jgi:P27 family predicted phage terminase small subunit
VSRTAQPAALKLLKGVREGRDSGGRKVGAGPNFRRIAPRPPSWLSREAAAEWRRVVPGLVRVSLLKEEDRAALAAYCETWSTYVTARREVAARGQLIVKQVTTKDGRHYEQEVANPSVAIARNEGKELRAWATHFGLTPSAEGSLSWAAADDHAGDDNPFAGGGG